MRILVVNCGSSSIKYQLRQMPDQQVLAHGIVERIGERGASLEHAHGDRVTRVERPIPNHETGIAMILDTLSARDSALDDVRQIGAGVRGPGTPA